MTNIHTTGLVIFLIALIFISAFFSGSETGMMALNRYRLRHLVRRGNLSAKRVMHLLSRPDRLLGIILIGNTFANILASAIATVLAVRYLGDMGVIVATVVLTFVILVFAETTPKTLAALHPQRVAFVASPILRGLLIFLYPLVWVINVLANGLLRIFGIKVRADRSEALNVDELRTVVREASGKISSAHQQMLLRILELEQATVDDVMVPRKEIAAIDFMDPWEEIERELIESPYEYLPIYREDIDQVIGLLSLRNIIPLLRKGELCKDKLLTLIEEVHFIPEVTLLNRQLLNFQQENKSIGLVVDEYGDIQGLIKLQDILEEIVGEFAVDVADTERMVQLQKDGSYKVDGSINIRDLNRITRWRLPTDGPRTLNGLIIEYLEMIPEVGLCLRLSGYPMEILAVSSNKIRQVQVWPEKYRVSS